MPDRTETWLGFRQNEERAIVATFIMPSGRLREVPLTEAQALRTLTELARAVRFTFEGRAS